MKLCDGCGKRQAERNRKHCSVCLDKLAEMKRAGYLQDVPRQGAPTIFNDERGRKLKRGWTDDATIEDDYSEEAEA